MAIDSNKMIDSCMKIKPHMPNMEVLLNQILVEITRPNKEFNDLENRSRLRIRPDKIVKRNKPSMRIRNNRGKIQWILQIQNGFLRIRRYPDHLRKKI